MSNLPSNCADTRACLPLFVGSDLDPEEQASVKAHLAECEDCRLHEDRARRARGVLASFLQSDGGAVTVQNGQGGDQAPVPEDSLWPAVRAGLLDAGLIAGEDARPNDILRPLPARERPKLADPLGPRSTGRRSSIQWVGLAAAAGLVMALGMIHFLGGTGSVPMGEFPGAGGTGVSTHSAGHQDPAPAPSSAPGARGDSQEDSEETEEEQKLRDAEDNGS